MKELKKKECGNIKILGRVPWDDCKKYLSEARALIFPGVEDFGMVPVEAMASGTPVIAYGKGGALETVIDGETGLFFYEQSIESLNACVEIFEKQESSFVLDFLLRQAEKFSKKSFKYKFQKFINDNFDQT